MIFIINLWRYLPNQRKKSMIRKLSDCVPPIDGIRLHHKPEVGVESPEYNDSIAHQQSGVLIVELVMKMSHFVGVFLTVVLVGGVEGEPFADFKHSGEEIHVLLERKYEIFSPNDSSLFELFILGQSP